MEVIKVTVDRSSLVVDAKTIIMNKETSLNVCRYGINTWFAYSNSKQEGIECILKEIQSCSDAAKREHEHLTRSIEIIKETYNQQ